jgi:hypothetical protein
VINVSWVIDAAVLWFVIISTWALAITCIWVGFKMGRSNSGEPVNLFPGATKKDKPYEDEPGGAFEDHEPGGKYDQIEEAENKERMQTI